MYDIDFSLSDLLHSIWQSLGPSKSLQMAEFHYFYAWVIFHCIVLYVSHRLYLFICQCTFRLPPYHGYQKKCCSEHWGACIFLNYGFLQTWADYWTECSDVDESSRLKWNLPGRWLKHHLKISVNEGKCPRCSLVLSDSMLFKGQRNDDYLFESIRSSGGFLFKLLMNGITAGEGPSLPGANGSM